MKNDGRLYEEPMEFTARNQSPRTVQEISYENVTEVAERHEPPRTVTVEKKNSKFLKIAVIFLFVLTFALIGIVVYSFVMTSQLQENEKLKSEGAEFMKTIKCMNETLLRLYGEIAAITPRASCEESVTKENGVVFVLKKGAPFQVYCDMSTDNGGWTVFQRRLDGSVDFNQSSDEYTQGFGNMSGEFWLGIKNIYQLTRDGSYELRVELTDWEGNSAYAKYGNFDISGRSDNYRLTVGQYSGTAGDSLSCSNNQPFSVRRKDNTSHRAGSKEGAWWYQTRAITNLNGVYNDTSNHLIGVTWWQWKKRRFSLKTSEMKFRKKHN